MRQLLMISDLASGGYSYIRYVSGFAALLLAFAALSVALKVLSGNLQISSLPLPPGPKPLPIIGNLFDFPNVQMEGPHFGEHKTTFGPISSISAFGTTFMIINDKTAAFELLDKKSLSSSNRPVAPFSGQMVGFDRWLTSFKQYNDEHKTHRRLMHNLIGTRAHVAKFEELEETLAYRFLLDVFNAPDSLMDHIRTMTGALILKISYGYTINPKGSDPLVDLAEEVTSDIFAKSFQAGQWIVDFMPFVRIFPEWLPGMGFKRMAREWSAKTISFCDKPYAFVKHQMASGKAISSFASECISSGVSENVGDDIVKSVAASLFAGGADTTVSALSTFFLAMVENPNVFMRAQEEMDQVVGTGRLPTFSDRPNLPYIEALMKETLRWETVVPTSPHLTTEEETYLGYRIPKDTVILPNLWQMSHDAESYADPSAFRPERFMGENGMHVEQDPNAFVFGFGRRVCPGKELADSSLFIAIAMSVAAFTIEKARDRFGREIKPLHKYTMGSISHPEVFKCRIKPRTEQVAALVRSIVDGNPSEMGDGAILNAL